MQYYVCLFCFFFGFTFYLSTVAFREKRKDKLWIYAFIQIALILSLYTEHRFRVKLDVELAMFPTGSLICISYYLISLYLKKDHRKW